MSISKIIELRSEIAKDIISLADLGGAPQSAADAVLRGDFDRDIEDCAGASITDITDIILVAYDLLKDGRILTWTPTL